MWLIPVAFAADMSWTCTETATLPEHVVAWKDASVEEAADAAWALAEPWIDPGCLTCVTDPKRGVFEDCEAVACVTADGAVLDYAAYEVYLDGEDVREHTAATSVTVAPPASAGLGWTELTVVIERDGGTDWDATTASVSWTGSLRADWPADSGFSARWWSDTTAWAYSSEGAAWDDGTCSWRSERDWTNQSWSVRMQDTTFELGFIYGTCAGTAEATVDDVFVGIPDYDTWALQGTDADGDGWPVEYGDCDDADATIHPCAEDPWDGADTDCDGTAEDDLDLDGYADVARGGDDCDDADATVFPGAPEVVCDDVDQDCDAADDRDGDDDGDACDTDCDDADPARATGLPEVACDGVDQDCDGIDASCASPEPEPEEEDAPAEDGCGGGAAALLLLLPLAGRRRWGRRGAEARP